MPSAKPQALAPGLRALLQDVRRATGEDPARAEEHARARREAEVKAAFAQSFGEAAQDPARFHALMKSVFGEGYDVEKAETFRQAALRGDYSWLPPVRLVDAATLGGANGAYDQASGTVLLNRELDPALAAQTYVEEAGHHLDAQLNKTDTQGDEGELFRRLILGEKLSAAEVAAIKSEDDKGVITVDGKQVEVEFWNPFKAIADAVSSVVDAVSTVVQAAVDVVSSAVRNVFEGVGQFFRGLGRIFTGDFEGGFKDLGLGLLKTFVQTPIDALLLGLGKGVSAIQTLFGLEPKGRKLRPDEIAILRQVYGDSIDYDKVVIKEGKAGLWSTNDRAFVHGNTVYMKDNVIDPHLLVHEMAHVWQFQNGGSDYMSEALVSQWWGKGYDWEASVPETAFEDLEPEQQAEFLADAYASGFFDSPGGRFIRGGVDYTDYLRDALAKVRSGQGAP